MFEVMLASGMMAIGLVGMIQVVISGSEMLDVSRKQTLATNIIHTQIDLYRASIPADWSQVSNGTTTTYLKMTPSGNGSTFVSTTTAPTSYQDYFTCQRVISNVATNGTLKKVAFTVTWIGATGRSYSRIGVTYISQYGLHVSLQRT